MKKLIIAVDDMKDFDTPFDITAEKLRNLSNGEIELIPLTGIRIAEALPKIEEIIEEKCTGDAILYGLLIDVLHEKPLDKNAGFKLARKVKKGRLTSHAKVLCMTSRHFDIDQDEYEKCGAEGLITRGHQMNLNQFAERIIQEFQLA